MKKLKIGIILTFLELGSVMHPQTQVGAILARAQQKQFAGMSVLEKDLHVCVQNFAQSFSDLSIGNISSKKPIIEQGRKQLLAILNTADTADMTQDYQEAKRILAQLDVNKIWVAVQDFKKVLNLIRAETKKLIDDTVTDLVIRKALGL